MKKTLSILMAAFDAASVVAAQFLPVGGGNIDDPSNWSGSGTLAVAQHLTGPLTLSKSPASMPSGTDILYFWDYDNICDFGVGNVLDLGSVPLSVEQNAVLRLTSGTIKGSIYVNEAYQGTGGGPGMLVLDGPDAVLEPTLLAFRCYQTSTSAWENKIVVTNGAKLAMGERSFTVYGGWNAGFALFTGAGSTLEAKNIYMGGQYGVEMQPLTGWSNHPGVTRTLEFANGATNEIQGSVFLGCNESVGLTSVSGGNILKVSSDAELTVGGTLYFSPSSNDGGMYDGSTNNVVLVDGGALKVLTGIAFGQDSAFRGNRLEVKGGGQLLLEDRSGGFWPLQIGMAADGDVLSVEGQGSVLDISTVKLFVGGRSPYASSDNLVEIKDGGRIQTGVDAFVGLMGGVNNRLRLSDNAVFQSTANLQISGPTSALEVVGSTVSISGDLTVESAAVGSSVLFGEGSALAANSLWLKTPTVFSATGATIDVQGLAFSDGNALSLTNSALTIHQNVPGSGGFGCNHGSISFHGGSVFNVPFRWAMKGDDFTVCLDDSTLDASGIAADWFITGEGDDGTRSFVFEGARPHLKTAGTGFYLRGTAVNLVFNLGKDGFPTDRPVVDVQGGGRFGADSRTSNTISVHVSGDCPSGVYTLMRGESAGTFIDSDCYGLTCEEGRKARLILSDNEVLVKVKEPAGLILTVR